MHRALLFRGFFRRSVFFPCHNGASESIVPPTFASANSGVAQRQSG